MSNVPSEVVAAAAVIRDRVGIPLIALDPGEVPEGLRSLLQEAMHLGISEGGTRCELLDALPPEYVRELIERITDKSDELEAFVYGPGMQTIPSTPTYAAFAALWQILTEGYTPS
jgi:hypothetical protein